MNKERMALIKRKIIDLSAKKSIFYAVLLFLASVIYLPFSFAQGFFWDDWCELLLHNKFGDRYFWDFYLVDRPLSAWRNYFYLDIIGNNPIISHILIVTLKLITVILLFKLMQILIPGHKFLHISVSLFYFALPIFSQLYISITYAPHFMGLAFFLASVLFFYKGINQPNGLKRVCLWLFSAFFTALHFSLNEYFVFLEFLKFPLLFWEANSGTFSAAKIKRKLFYYFPQFSLLILFIFFRMNIGRFFPIRELDSPKRLAEIIAQPKIGLQHFFTDMATDFCYIFFNFPGKAISFPLENLTRPFTGIVLLVMALVFIILFLYLNNIPSNDKLALSEKGFSLRAPFLFGLLWVILGILPFWIMGDNIISAEDTAHADRCFFAAAPGIALAFVTLIIALFKSRNNISLILAIATALMTRFAYQENDIAKWRTKQQRQFFWQLKERAPALLDNTAIIDDDVIFPFQGNYATASAVNILYDNETAIDREIPIWIFRMKNIPFEEHPGFKTSKRIFNFSAPSGNTIVVDHNNKFANCLWVFSPDDVDHPHISEVQKSWIAHTNLDRILPQSDSRPNELLFGKENKNWCYYYQNASFALSRQKWDLLNAITQEVFNRNISPADSQANSPYEWWPFVAGLLHSEDYSKAAFLSDQALNMDFSYRDYYCARWEKTLNEKFIEKGIQTPSACNLNL